MRALHGGEVGLGGVVLVEFLLDVVVDGGGFFLQRVDQFGDGFVGAVFDFVPLEGLEVLVYGSCSSVSVWGLVSKLFSRGGFSILSLTTFCCCIFSSSPPSRFLSESDIRSTTPLHPCSSLASSSACCTNASRVPTLNSGIAKGICGALIWGYCGSEGCESVVLVTGW